MLLLPFCASVPYAISQVDEIRTSFLEWKVLRGSIRQYSFNKIVATMLSAAVATSMAFALHALVWNFIAYPYDLVAHPYQEIPFSANCIYSNWTDIFYWISDLSLDDVGNCFLCSDLVSHSTGSFGLGSR